MPVMSSAPIIEQAAQVKLYGTPVSYADFVESVADDELPLGFKEEISKKLALQMAKNIETISCDALCKTYPGYAEEFKALSMERQAAWDEVLGQRQIEEPQA